MDPSRNRTWSSSTTYGAPPDCGKRYAYLVQSGGYGPDNPTGYKPWASEADLAGWLATAANIFARVRESWNALVRAENLAKTWTESAAVQSFVESYEADYASLPESKWYQVAGAGDEIARVVSNAQTGVCALELLQDALARMGGGETTPVPWGPEPGSGDGLGVGLGVLLAAAVAGLVFFGGKKGWFDGTGGD